MKLVIEFIPKKSESVFTLKPYICMRVFSESSGRVLAFYNFVDGRLL